jgi:hypothetical protein
MKIYEKLKNKLTIKHDPMRRKLLGTGVAAGVVIPLGGQHTLQTLNANRLVQFATIGTHAYGDGQTVDCNNGGIIGTDAQDDNEPHDIKWGKIVNFVKEFGIPQFKKDSIWEDARRIYRLDPDLMCNRSMSMAGKIHIQRQRRYDQLHEKALDKFEDRDPIKEFVRKHPKLKNVAYWF